MKNYGGPFKMVTFSLGGRDYGVNIMHVGEIARSAAFTPMPQAPSFVRGVYNLRGEIIPVIDLRAFFHLLKTPEEPRAEDVNIEENLLIFHINGLGYGAIVDKIHNVVPLDPDSIQPPHPAFGEENVKYIEGVAEKNGVIYAILNIENIFTGKNADTAAIKDKNVTSAESSYKNVVSDKDVGSWPPEYYSAEYAAGFKKALLAAERGSRSFQVWNPGCGRGWETYSIACLVKEAFPDSLLKIWACDSDVLAIAEAASLRFPCESAPEFCKPFLVKCRGGCAFNEVIKSSIVFEWHDVREKNDLPPLDLLVCGRLLPLLDEAAREKFLQEAAGLLKPGAVFLPGAGGGPGPGWRPLECAPVRAYKRDFPPNH